MKNNFVIADDQLIQDLLAAKGKRVEVFAFGITYIGKLTSVDTENGFISVTDGEDTAMLELERIEQFSLLEAS
ncbi:MAG: hypothetical protein HYY43_02380 [Deltaproteobacteria bacterium]|nr:hypothetical protein [Deltaproteobacteria bacterium]MBI2341734.1 hypothetical protein [Deltaproteobacteria bacterium]MBI2974422.1 hypothetical protein [Deltaproteobacteria bacterium]